MCRSEVSFTLLEATADQHIVFNLRIFCTRWNGTEKGSIFDDALDDKEYEGNLTYLLQSGCDFVRNDILSVQAEETAKFNLAMASDEKLAKEVKKPNK